jgi:uncharacterized membrane protein YhaH (DUF805 family)
MTFVESLRICILEKYCDFKGRAQRSELWWFYLFTIIVYLICNHLMLSPDLNMHQLIGLAIIEVFFVLPNIAVSVRRLHDTNKSGSLYFLMMIPLVGPFILLYLCTLPGTPGPNKFGPDPLNSTPLPPPVAKIDPS